MNWLNKTKRGYVYDKRIFWLVITFTVVAVMYIFYMNSFDFAPHPYFECKIDSCKNPFYGVTDCRQQLTILFVIPIYTTSDCRENNQNSWMEEEYLSEGNYGHPPPTAFIYKYLKIIIIIIFALAMFSNHLIHNKGKQFDIEIPITKKRIINRDTFKSWGESLESDKNNK